MTNTSMHSLDLDVVCRVETMSEQQLQKARLAVCDYVDDKDEAAELLSMLGLDAKPARPARRVWVPATNTSEADCVRCGRKMVRRHPEGAQVRYGSRGLCEPCYKRQKPAEVTPAMRALWELLRGPDWMRKAACAESPEPELWHPEPKAPINVAALTACWHCPVIEQCGAHAIVSGATSGVWAGLRLDDSAGRKKLRERYGVPAKPRKQVLQRETKTCACGVTYETGSNAATCWACRDGYVLADEAREHLFVLLESMTQAQVVVLSGLSETTVKALKTKRGVRKATADAILAIDIPVRSA